MFTLDCALKEIENRKDFFVKDDGYVTSINYLFIIKDTFNSNIRKNLRGTVFSNKTGKIISLPFHKFFNINEKEQTQLNKLVGYQQFKYAEKFDGSMIHFYKHPKHGIVSATKAGCATVTAKLAMNIYNKRLVEINKFIEQGFTPIYELIGKDNKHIVQYDENQLQFLVARNNANGKYKLSDNWTEYNDELENLLLKTKEKINSEGVVVFF